MSNLFTKANNKLLKYVFRKFFISYLYETKVGIKSLNQIVSSGIWDIYIRQHLQPELIEINPSNLKLGIDGLRDKYTHINKSIFDSPHYELVKSIYDAYKGSYNILKVIKNSSYLKKFKKGILDFRNPTIVSDNYIKFMENRFLRILRRIEEGNIPVIKIIKVKNNFYIADGKHKAAMCALFNINCKCVDMSWLIYDSWYYWIYNKIKKSNNKILYSKHLLFFKDIGYYEEGE